MKSYQEEHGDLYHRRTSYILVVFSCMIMLFSLLDVIIAPEYFIEFFFYRLIAAFIGMVLLFLNYHDQEHNFAALFGFTAYLCVASVTLIIVYRLGSAISPYYVGLLVTIAIYGTLAPLTLPQTLGSGFLIIICYAIIAFLAPEYSSADLVELFTNLFFMACFVFIIATQSWVACKAKKREYTLHKEENEAAEELAEHAMSLEMEVRKRSREQAASEERYRQLFSQIADDVVVIGQNGEILQSNINFNNHYAVPKATTEMSFFDLILEQQKNSMQKALTEMIANNTSLPAYRVSLIKTDTTITEAEINASLLKRNEKIIGILVIIRDIDPRIRLERQLIDSLKTKKKTETAAILALAKLSEFKAPMTDDHLERIREYCRILASELSNHPQLQDNIPPSFIEDIYNACILQDIGRVAIPDEVLQRTSHPQTSEEDQLRQHPIIGGDIIKDMERKSEGPGFLSMAKHIAYFHHERWDGKGYPYGLTAQQIPLAARIMAVANTYEEMTAGTEDSMETASHRNAVHYIEYNTGRRFDPTVVIALLARQRELKAIRQAFPAH